VREHNEDAIGANLDIALLVLADGMGGYNAGEVASGIAVTDGT
jgi:serine/threonine protein phosphatase PrpC